MTRIVFEDCEFTSLVPPYRPGGSRLWEVGLIVRDERPGMLIGAAGNPWEEAEHRWLVSDVDLSAADPRALEVGRFYDRHPLITGTYPGDGVGIPEEDVAWEIAHLITPGCTVVGAAPAGDVDHLRDLLFRWQLPWVAHHHVIDIESWAVGYLSVAEYPFDLPWKYRDVLAALGITQAEDQQQHTALGDARIVRDVWDATTSGRP